MGAKTQWQHLSPFVAGLTGAILTNPGGRGVVVRVERTFGDSGADTGERLVRR